MEFHTRDASKIFILGAGASVEYGLPLWRELPKLIKKELSPNYINSKSILDWIMKVGNKYDTIDECITNESISKEYHNNGEKIENDVFKIMEIIFLNKYKKNENGWIRVLNDKIKDTESSSLERDIIFINYNYDNVLDKNYLNFDYLPSKLRNLNNKDRLDELSEVKNESFHPHGCFEYNSVGSSIKKYSKTFKHHNPEYVGAISCHESDKHKIKSYYDSDKSLYILGIGGGLEVNLENLIFENCFIKDIHITWRDSSKKNKITEFLCEKFNIVPEKIFFYHNCTELIEKCF